MSSKGDNEIVFLDSFYRLCGRDSSSILTTHSIFWKPLLCLQFPHIMRTPPVWEKSGTTFSDTSHLGCLMVSWAGHSDTNHWEVWVQSRRAWKRRHIRQLITSIAGGRGTSFSQDKGGGVSGSRISCLAELVCTCSVPSSGCNDVSMWAELLEHHCSMMTQMQKLKGKLRNL